MYAEDCRSHSAIDGKNPEMESVADGLEDSFYRFFVLYNDSSTCDFMGAITNINTKKANVQKAGTGTQDTPRLSMTYEELLFLLTQELVEMLALRFGDLGCYQVTDRRPRYLISCLSHDDTTEMFDPSTPGPSPLLEYQINRTVQMIEVWFQHHPLSFIISKSLLLQSLQNNSCDEILLALILADVHYAQEDEQARAKGEEMFRWAGSQLHGRTMASMDLAVAQVLTLLGWHSLCTSRARRAVCYLSFAGELITRLPTPEIGTKQVNGIDVGEVEGELSRNVYWLTSSITLWACMQMDTSLIKVPQSVMSTSFPPMDETASAVIKLDMRSDNTSTLLSQRRMIRELWPLSHIASTITHIYDLYPRDQNENEASQSLAWQLQTLYQLRDLSSRRQDISILCAKVRRILLDALTLLEAHVGNPSSHAHVLSAYHSIIIHFLFPRSDSISGPVVVTEALIDEFCYSAEAILKASAVFNEPESGRVIVSARQSPTIAEVFALGMDACSRAINYFYRRYQIGSQAEMELVLKRNQQLAKLASELHALSKNSKLRALSRSAMVKKQLKHVMRSLASLGLATPRSNTIRSPMTGLSPASQSYDMTTSSMTADPTSSAAMDFDNHPIGMEVLPFLDLGNLGNLSSTSPPYSLLPTPSSVEPASDTFMSSFYQGLDAGMPPFSDPNSPDQVGKPGVWQDFGVADAMYLQGPVMDMPIMQTTTR